MPNHPNRGKHAKIAAELLSELKSLTDRLAHYAKFPKCEQDIYIENARAVIAKAEKALPPG